MLLTREGPVEEAVQEAGLQGYLEFQQLNIDFLSKGTKAHGTFGERNI